MNDELRNAFRLATANMTAYLPALRDGSRGLGAIVKALDCETEDVHPDLHEALRADGESYLAALAETNRVLGRYYRRSRKIENLVWAHTPKAGK